MSLKYDDTDERMTLWASRVLPSEQASVTSTKSCLEWRSRKVVATFMEKSFHFRLYFWAEPILSNIYLVRVTLQSNRLLSQPPPLRAPHSRRKYLSLWHAAPGCNFSPLDVAAGHGVLPRTDSWMGSVSVQYPLPIQRSFKRHRGKKEKLPAKVTTNKHVIQT